MLMVYRSFKTDKNYLIRKIVECRTFATRIKTREFKNQTGVQTQVCTPSGKDFIPNKPQNAVLPERGLPARSGQET
jgi:hypothetical protein